jgi:hypothetical protein
MTRSSFCPTTLRILLIRLAGRLNLHQVFEAEKTCSVGCIMDIHASIGEYNASHHEAISYFLLLGNSGKERK